MELIGVPDPKWGLAGKAVILLKLGEVVTEDELIQLKNYYPGSVLFCGWRPSLGRLVMFSGFRALDLTDERGHLCGKILGDLGVDVIKIEKPGGDPARNIGPFYKDKVNPQGSLYWFFFNASKRGITLNIETTNGQDIFKRLARTVDFVIESFPPGTMDRVGLGYSALSKISPRIIMASITPFGQTGPHKHYKTSEIVALATSGVMAANGDPDRAPLRMNPHFCYAMAGANAAVGVLVANYYRQVSDEGQHVDVSIQESAAQLTFGYPAMWEMLKSYPKRMGMYIPRYGGGYSQLFFPCKDGWVTWLLFGGQAGADSHKALTKWMDEEGMAGNWTQIDWDKYNPNAMSQVDIDANTEVLARFLAQRSKREIEEEGGVKRGTRTSAVANAEEVSQHKQLAFRGFWQQVDYPHLDASIVQSGQFYLSDKTQSRIRHPAPRIGEHNDEIYEGELGLSRAEIATLRYQGVV